MLLAGVSVWYLHMHQNCVYQLFYADWATLTWSCGNWHNRQKSAKLRVFEPASELFDLALHLRILRPSWEHVDLVHRDDELVHQYLSQNDALRSLGLYQFLRVDD